jgi:hypothetical protein
MFLINTKCATFYVMETLNIEDYKYLNFLYHKVGAFLSGSDTSGNFNEQVISFCVFTEKVLKIKLYQENPVLIFPSYVFNKEHDALIAIVKGEDKNIETINFGELFRLFQKIFSEVFTDTDIEALEDVYKLRNEFIHGYKTDERINFTEEDILKKMGTLWGKISSLVVDLFGNNIKEVQVKKLYTDKELEDVIRKEMEKEVQEKIRMGEPLSYGCGTNRFGSGDYSLSLNDLGSERCPRCRKYGFKRVSGSSFDRGGPGLRDVVVRSYFRSRGNGYQDGLFVCSNCGLELTEKEYEIAKRLKFK